MNHTHRIAASLTVLAFILTGAHSAHALGFRNPDQNAAATAQGEAFVAQADDASAVYYNPAGLTQIRGTEFQAGALYMLRDVQMDGDATNEKMNDPAMLPHLYAASDLGKPDSPLRIGFGVNVPFGLAVNWGNNSSLRFRVTDAEMRVVSITPTIAYQFNEHLSLGIGVNIYYGDTSLENHVLLAAPPVPEGRFRFHGDGLSAGLTLGGMWKFNDQHTIGVVYRCPFDIDFEGDAIIKDDPTGLFGRTAAETNIQYPQSVALGYAFRPMPKLKLEVDIEWTNWDMLNNVVLKSPNPGFNGITIPFNWMDSWFYEFGGEYKLNDAWALRAGYIYSTDTVPNQTFSPTVPDSDRHVFSVGVGFHTARVGCDLTYQYSLSVDRTIKNSADTNFDGVGDLNGEWSGQAHAIMLTGNVRF